ncbi:MAG: hypothetical protein RhofKO_25620 [Rhodothermales bacterium]
MLPKVGGLASIVMRLWKMLRKRHSQFTWENDLKGLLGEHEELKISSLRDQVYLSRDNRFKASIIPIVLSTAIIGISIVCLWLFAELENKDRADLANGVVAFILAVWAFTKSRSSTLDRDSVQKITDKVVPTPTLEKIIKDASKIPISANKAIPMIAAIALVLILFLKHIDS